MNKNEWKSYFAKLGRGANAVAKSLKALGITGVPKDPNSCPIARYVMLAPIEPNRTRSADIDTDSIDITEQNGDVVEFHFETNQGISDFITKFDERKYPDLIEPTWVDPDHDNPEGESAGA